MFKKIFSLFEKKFVENVHEDVMFNSNTISLKIIYPFKKFSCGKRLLGLTFNSTKISIKYLVHLNNFSVENEYFKYCSIAIKLQKDQLH